MNQSRFGKMSELGTDSPDEDCGITSHNREPVVPGKHNFRLPVIRPQSATSANPAGSPPTNPAGRATLFGCLLFNTSWPDSKAPAPLEHYP
jgi:hypothetical protein